jgi:DNA-binding MurR/RpiR family transcriptional regulator
MKTGKPVAAYVDTHMQVMAASLLGKGDVVVGISHSGSSRDIIEALELARKKGATTIGLTHYAKSPIDKVLDIKLCTASNETFYRTESTSSRIAQLSIIDALFIGVSLRDPEKAIENIQLTREAIASKRF